MIGAKCGCCGLPVLRIAALGFVVLGRKCAPYVLCHVCLTEIETTSPEHRENLFTRVELTVLPAEGRA